MSLDGESKFLFFLLYAAGKRSVDCLFCVCDKSSVPNDVVSTFLSFDRC